MRDINIKATEYFEAVARLGTVTKAASELGVSASAVSQQIRLLESQFGVRLFRREKKRLVLTLDGDRLFKTTTQAFRAIRNAKNAIIQQRERRTCSMRVSPTFGVRWLSTRIGSFIADHPGWNLRVDATPDFSDFDGERIDLDLRYGVGGWGGLAQRDVMSDLVLPLCSPSYRDALRAGAGAGDAAAMLRAATIIDSAKALMRWDLWLAHQGMDAAGLSHAVRFDRSSMSIELAKRGGGLALENAALCLPEIAGGDLVPLLPELPVVDFAAYHLVCPHGHLERPVVASFSAWVIEAGQAHEAAVRACLLDLGCSFARPGNLLPEWPVSRS